MHPKRSRYYTFPLTDFCFIYATTYWVCKVPISTKKSGKVAVLNLLINVKTRIIRNRVYYTWQCPINKKMNLTYAIVLQKRFLNLPCVVCTQSYLTLISNQNNAPKISFWTFFTYWMGRIFFQKKKKLNFKTWLISFVFYV